MWCMHYGMHWINAEQPTNLIFSQSAGSFRCFVVLPWTVIHDAPACSAWQHNSTVSLCSFRRMNEYDVSYRIIQIILLTVCHHMTCILHSTYTWFPTLPYVSMNSYLDRHRKAINSGLCLPYHVLDEFRLFNQMSSKALLHGPPVGTWGHNQSIGGHQKNIRGHTFSLESSSTSTESHYFGIAINAHELTCFTRSHGCEERLFFVRVVPRDNR